MILERYALEAVLAIVLVLLGIWLLIQILIKVLPVIVRFLLYSVIAIPLWIVALLTPGFILEGVLVIYPLYRAIVKSWDLDLPLFTDIFDGRSDSYSSSDSGGDDSYSYSYVLNRRTGVIHDRWDASVDTIGERNKRYISSTEAWELVNRGGRYRFKE